MTLGLRVASYNIRKCVGLDRRRDPERVLDVIAGLEADIVALQEADRRLGDRPATLDRERISELTGLEAIDVARNDVSLGWHGNAILINPGVEIEAVEPLDLPGLEPRGAVLVQARHKERTFRIVAAHLGLTREFRRRQLRVIVRAAHRAGPDVPTMIMGDFNEWRMDRGLEPLGREFSIHAPGLSFHAARPVAALDRIAVNSAVEVNDAGVFRTEASRIASDHLPIWADIRMT